MRDRTNWGWNWSTVKTVLEWLFYVGEVTVGARNSPVRAGLRPARAGAAAGGARSADADPRRVACVELVRRAAPALGVGHRVRACATTSAPARTMTQAGHRRAGRVGRAAAGRRRRAGRAADVPVARGRGCRAGSTARALLSPFDSLIFERARLEQLFDFRYRIEIYVPEPQAGARLLRLPVPARRPARRPGRPQGRPGPRGAAGELGLAGGGRRAGVVAAELAAELASLAAWQGLSAVEVLPRGDLAPALAAARPD